MAWHAPREGRPGRPPVFSDAAIQFCLSIKMLFKLPLRQTAGMVASLLRLAGLDWPVPDYSTLCRRQKTLQVQIPYRRADGPLNLLVDSTGIKLCQCRRKFPQSCRSKIPQFRAPVISRARDRSSRFLAVVHGVSVRQAG